MRRGVSLRHCDTAGRVVSTSQGFVLHCVEEVGSTQRRKWTPPEGGGTIRTAMDALEIARWQFGITTVYHFMMVPLTIGLGLVVAVIQTLWYRTGKVEYLRMTKFWGKLFLINFIMGVATGIV